MMKTMDDDIICSTLNGCIHERKNDCLSTAIHFHANDHDDAYLIVDEEIELFDIVQILYNYIMTNPHLTADWFCLMFPHRKEMLETEYRELIRKKTVPALYGVYDIDFDSGEVSVPSEGGVWLTYGTRTLSAARHEAMRQAHITDDQCRYIFCQQLIGKCIPNTGCLRKESAQNG